MAGVFGAIFGRVNKPAPAETMLRIQSSIEGRAIAIGAGQNRLTANTVLACDFKASAASSGGKGAGGSSGKGNSGTYNYSSSFVQSIGQGPLTVQSIINGNQIDFLVTPSAQIQADLALLNITPTYGDTWGGTFLSGSYSQSAWSYLTSVHPALAQTFHGQALACYANLALGNSASLPNFNYEVLWGISADIPALGPDANPADWIGNCLSNADWGIGFPAALTTGFANYRLFARAAGLMISPVLTSQQAASSHFSDIMTGTVSAFRWSNGQLDIVPLIDQPIAGNGYSFTPNLTPVYDLTVDDFLEYRGSLGNTGTSGVTPVAIERKDPAQIVNRLQLEYLDRANLYNSKIIYASDGANIAAARRQRMSDVRSHRFFCLASAASMSLSLQMQREKIRLTYGWTLSEQFILLDVGDNVTLTEPYGQLNRQLVRITEITEENDGALTYVAEHVQGVAAPPVYVHQPSLGGGRNTNVDPGPINPPVIFEPPDALAGGLQIWMAVSGQDIALWGGCEVYVSSSANGTYSPVATIEGPARQGVLTAGLAAVTASTTGQTIDQVNTLAVSLTESGGSLASGLSADMTSLNTAAYVDGEIIAYQTATLTGANAYSLAPLVRGAYGTPISAHATGAQFARLDEAIAKYAFTQDRIGQQIYIKFVSFNIYGGGGQGLDAVSPIAYTILGTALASPLPDVTNLRTIFESNVMKLYWDEVSDFRPVQYEIRKGTSWGAGVKVGTLAHPPFTVLGDDTYWVAAVSQPTAYLVVYSADPAELVAAGSLLDLNIIRTINEQSSGWSGTLSSGVVTVGSGPSATLALDGATYAGTYTPNDSHIIDIGYPAPALIGASYVGTGSPAGQNFLEIADFLATADLLGSALGRYVDVHLEIAVGTGVADFFAPGDVFGQADVFIAGMNFGPWQKFVPGVYYGRYFRVRAVLATVTLQAIPSLLSMSWSVMVEDRVDHYVNQAVGTGGLTLAFTPDGATTPLAFNAGLNGAALPQIYVSWQMQAGDSYTLSGESLAGVTLTFFNAGFAVARTATIEVQGF